MRPPLTPRIRSPRRRAGGLLALLAALALAMALPAPVAAQTPAQQQYDDNVPGRGGQGSNGAGGAQGGKRGDKGENGRGEGQGGPGSERANATFSDSDDDGGLSTLAIVLIALTVIAAGTLAFVWLRGRGGPEPPEGGAAPPAPGPPAGR